MKRFIKWIIILAVIGGLVFMVYYKTRPGKNQLQRQKDVLPRKLPVV